MKPRLAHCLVYRFEHYWCCPRTNEWSLLGNPATAGSGQRRGVAAGMVGGTAVATPVCGGLCRHKPFRAPFVAAGVATAGSYSRDKSRRADADLWDASDFCKPAYRRAGSLAAVAAATREVVECH
jgi:hypothetical protein